MRASRHLQSLLTLTGVGLGLAALWTGPFGTSLFFDGEFTFVYWNMSRSNGAMALALLVACTLLLVASIVLGRELLRTIAACIGGVLVGYFSLVFFWVGRRLDLLEEGAWLGLVGSLLIVAGTVPLRRRAARRDVRRKSPHGLLVARLLALVGLSMGLGSIWTVAVVRGDGGGLWAFFLWNRYSTYWDAWDTAGVRNPHWLGTWMLVLVLVATLSVLGSFVLRGRALGLVALGASLVLFGLMLFYPAVEISHPRFLGPGAWLGLVGAALAVAGSAAAVWPERHSPGRRSASSSGERSNRSRWLYGQAP